MDFEHSTQARSWMFDEESLLECKYEASAVKSISKTRSAKPRVHKFACGFREKSAAKRASSVKREADKLEKPSCSSRCLDSMPTKMPSCDQETLVHFHAHQIQRLVGPNAIFPKLRRSASVLSTAIMLFRRFYLSNSVIDFHPRNIAAASALLAVKVDCELRLEIDLLAHATSVVNLKARKARLCREELRAVSIEEIEAAERALLEGLDYRLRCHHPYGAIKVLASDIAAYLASSVGYTAKSSTHYGYHSPRGAMNNYFSDQRLSTLCERALAIAQSALVYSDVNFLFPPGQIAFAAVTIALEGNGYGGQLGIVMRNYLRMRFPQKAAEELSQFEHEVESIISTIERCPAIDLNKFSPASQRTSTRATQNQAAEVRRVFSVAAHFRGLSNAVKYSQPTQVEIGRKRMRLDDDGLSSQPNSKAARVTPNQTPYF